MNLIGSSGASDRPRGSAGTSRARRTSTATPHPGGVRPALGRDHPGHVDALRGPLYSFYTPYHLCHFEVPTTIARAVLFGDATIRPLAARLSVEVVTTAKTALGAGTVLEGLPGYHYYGQAERADVTATERLLPVGVAASSRLVRDVPQDAVLPYDDVEVPEGRLVDALRAAQGAVLEPA